MNPRHKLECTRLGVYKPSFFYIEIDTRRDLYGMLGQKEERVLAHEFIHFLQDISTVFGNMNLSHSVEQLRTLSKEIRSTADTLIPTPVDVYKYESIRVNAELFSFYYGERDDYSQWDHLGIVDIECEETIISKERALKGKEVTLLFSESNTDEESEDDETEPYMLGAIDILESMVTILEEHIYGPDEAAPQLPYRTASLVTEFLHPEANRPEIVSALCECALHLYNPAEFFYTTLVNMAAEGFVPDTIDDVASFAFENIRFEELNVGSLGSVEALVEYASSQATEFVCDWVKSDHTQAARAWVKEKLAWGRAQRLKDPLFLTRTFLDSSTPQEIQGLMNSIGLPPVFNRRGLCWASPSQPGIEKELGYFRAMWQIYDHLWLGEDESCSLFKFCSRLRTEGKIQYEPNHECAVSPWSRQHNEALCPYSMMWTIWGFQGKNLLFPP